MFVLDSKALGMFREERLLVLLSDVLLALLLFFRLLENICSTGVSANRCLWLFGGLRCLDSGLELQTAGSVFPNILAREMMTSKVGALQLISMSRRLLDVFLLLLWEKWLILLVRL
jgi:hypothetical protein